MRVPVYASNGVVATSQPLAAQAGLAILREGGNAVDAAIAAAVTLTVVQPGSNDIGSDLFAQVWDGSTLHGLNGSGRTPAALTPAHMRAGDSTHGWLPVTVPGAPAAWRDLHERFGQLPFERLFTDAIRYAEEGFPVSPVVAAGWGRVQVPDLLECRAWHDIYAPRAAGEIHRNPGKGRALRLIAGSHAGEFYHGEIADALHDLAVQTGGLLTKADLEAHSSEWVTPMDVTYRGHRVHELPPNGQGIVALEALGILDGLPGHGLHEQIEATKLGFADAHAYAADNADMLHFVDKSYLEVRRKLITDRAGDPPPGDPMRGGTVYLATADSHGMMVSLIQSNYMGFGSYVVLPDYGFGLQNRGAGLSLVDGHPNVAGPGKRPFHTIIPGFLSRDDGTPVGPFGVMGGHMQPQGHVQLVLSTVDDGLDPQAALDRPRWYWQSGRTLLVEPLLEGVDDLRTRGHDVQVTTERAVFGMGQAIWRLPDGHAYIAGSEPRADGHAAAF
ncbi:gamma-glutamyltransferase family protein [Allorhizocola rhizosphaerae]|uniref:gamma-glutamyltransferase family protein n=1 Tax=Allorhizocola rhizosphaerae TaxID=1872709 RepID=UPI0013C34C53|nr:gamma-glutamyltransferase family protein [Allorhizocola rhizosphaerae]